MKTIEEAINEISNQLLSGMNKDSYTKDEIGDMFDKILLSVHSLPLADRLTSEEREKIKSIYKFYVDLMEFHHRKCNSAMNEICRIISESNFDKCKSKADLLEDIFGKELFAEEGDENGL